MSQFFDYDPDQGIKTDFEYDDETGMAYLHHKQDITGFVDECKRKANDPDKTNFGIKRRWWHYASIPMIVIMKMHFFMDSP